MQASTTALFDRLLSHRVRGFSSADSSLAGVRAALAKGVRHIEIDIRRTRDGVVIACHDPFIKAANGYVYVQHADWAELRSISAGHELATLSDILRAFAAEAPAPTKLHLDIKETGFESALIAELQTLRLMSRVVIVSWIPEVLRACHRLAASVPLCFSHLTFTRLPVAYRIGTYLHERHPLVLQYLSAAVMSGDSVESAKAQAIRFHDNGDVFDGPPIPPEATPVHIVPYLLDGPMLTLLTQSNGLVCIPKPMATRALVERYHALGVKVAVFALGKATPRSIVEKLDADILYIDDPRAFAVR